jgi:hypothetical protein
MTPGPDDRFATETPRATAVPPPAAFPCVSEWAAKRAMPNTFCKTIGWLYRNRIGPFAS